MGVYKVYHAKLLGVTISHDLTWNKHVENIVKKAGNRLYKLYQLKRAGISQNYLSELSLSSFLAKAMQIYSMIYFERKAGLSV